VSRPPRISCNSAWSGAWGASTNRPTTQFVIAELTSDLVLSATLRDSTLNFDVEPLIHLRGELHRELPLDKRGPDPEGLNPVILTPGGAVNTQRPVVPRRRPTPLGLSLTYAGFVGVRLAGLNASTVNANSQACAGRGVLLPEHCDPPADIPGR